MVESMFLAFSTYEQAQQALFRQILNSVRIAVLALTVLLVVGLLFPALRTPPVAIIGGVLICELGAAELGRWLMDRKQLRVGATLYIILTLILAALVGIALRLPAFTGIVGAIMIAISALLVGPQYALGPGVASTILFALVAIVDALHWFEGGQIPGTFEIMIPLQILFVATAIAVMIIVSVLASSRLQRSAHDAQERAAEAEQAHTAQAGLNQQLDHELREQARLLDVIRELETPIMPISANVLMLPLVGHLDQRRLDQIERRLLQRVAATQTELVLIDITGVSFINTAVAQGLIRLSQAVLLLGAQVTFTGIQPAIAQTLVQLGADLGFVSTFATIRDALTRVDLR